MTKRISAAMIAVALSALVGACGFNDNPVPETLSFRMEGTPGTEVTLRFSKQFVAGQDETGGTVVTVLSSDSVTASLPIDTVFDIKVERRFFIMAIPKEDSVGVKVIIDVNDRNVFSSEGALFIEDPWRFAYLFNQLTTQSVDVVF